MPEGLWSTMNRLVQPADHQVLMAQENVSYEAYIGSREGDLAVVSKLAVPEQRPSYMPLGRDRYRTWKMLPRKETKTSTQ